jgi:glycine/D-amino acid oxidase-like deaminating enzyme
MRADPLALPSNAMETGRCDVLVIGGAIMGSSVAYFLKTRAPGLDVCVVEPDPTYEWCSTLRASGGVRVLFSCPREHPHVLVRTRVHSGVPRVHGGGWARRAGGLGAGRLLFIVPPAGLALLEGNERIQRAEGCDVALLTPAELSARFPSMRVDDLGGGVHSPGDGWCDPNGLLQGFKRKAIALGARYVTDRVVALSCAGSVVRSATLASGEAIAADTFVNAAGPWAAQVGAMADMRLPISPLRRFEHYFTAGTPIERLPYVKDLDRLAFRSEGAGFSGGLVDGDAARGFDFDIDHDYSSARVWPALAARFPAFEAVKCHRTWSGLYEQCELDGNPIIGNWPGRRDNLYVVGGFSGHGMMHAPAAGRAIAELIVDRRFITIDLARLGYARVLRNEPYAEAGIV